MTSNLSFNKAIRFGSRKIAFFLLTACLFTSSTLVAQVSPWLLESYETKPEIWNYLGPNEFYPVRAKPIFKLAPVGTYIGVGADRTFNLASLSPNINRILCLDADPQIVVFNLMNIFFLRASSNLEDYRHLRLEASAEEIHQRLQSLIEKLPIPVIKAMTMDNLKNLRVTFKADSHFANLHEADGFGDYNPFAGANYLRNRIQYSRLKKMADLNRIEAHIVNLKNPEFLTDLTKKISNELSVIDLSNAWGNRYIGQEWVQKILEKLSVKNPKALFVYTSIIPGSWMCDFDYGSVRLENRSMLDRTIYATENTPFGILDKVVKSPAAGGSCHGLF